MNENKFDFTDVYEKPKMELIEMANECVIVTSGCGSWSCSPDNPDENEGPGMVDF